MTSNSNDIRATRLQKRAKLIEEDGLYATKVDRTHTLAQVRREWGDLPPNTVTERVVEIAGRVMFKRGSGKIAFASLQEGDGTRLQVMLAAQDLGVKVVASHPELLDVYGSVQDDVIAFGKKEIKSFDKYVDLGDFVWVRGNVATSIKGELSIRATEWRVINKSIEPLPFLHAPISDEMRVRRPYLPLISEDEARNRVYSRAKVLKSLRGSLESAGFLEVETPILQPVHGGAQARPFTTHVNALDQDFSLRIALELPLKKLVVGGIDSVFEIGKVFRNEGIDSSHHPEFTMLEAYKSYWTMEDMAKFTQKLFVRVADSLDLDRSIEVECEGTPELIHLGSPWHWVSVYEGLSEVLGVSVTPDTGVDELRELAESRGVEGDSQWDAGKWVMELVSELLEPTLIQPTFLYDWPAEAQPLAARHPEDPRRVLAWDLIINGTEVATAFTELIDPVVQREVLEDQALRAAGGDPEAMEVDEDFLQALEIGSPPMAGLGVGVDRLISFFTGASVRESITFPLLRRLDG